MIFTWIFGLNFIALQGTKVLENREIRSTFHVTEDVPPQHALPGIAKYTGNLTEPGWKDVDPGRVFSFPSYLVKSAQNPKDMFETLCYVKADISSAPYTSHFSTTRGMSYRRKYDVILLVGLTELKAQVSWTDSETVRAHLVSQVRVYLIRFAYA